MYIHTLVHLARVCISLHTHTLVHLARVCISLHTHTLVHLARVCSFHSMATVMGDTMLLTEKALGPLFTQVTLTLSEEEVCSTSKEGSESVAPGGSNKEIHVYSNLHAFYKKISFRCSLK